MCCYANRLAKKELLKRFGKNQTIVLWKVLRRSGEASITNYQYHPGIHKLKFPLKKYRVDDPKGFHVYINKPTKSQGDRVIPVVCHRNHLVRVSRGFYDQSWTQAVFTQITILKKDWDKAFAPTRKEQK
jgi:hypothetical protein